MIRGCFGNTLPFLDADKETKTQMFARLSGTIALVYRAAAILSYPITGVGGVVAVVISLYFVLAFFNRLDAASRRVSGGRKGGRRQRRRR
jgi:hypothetical protein